jgi:GTPase SAR1 family protein
MTFYEVSAKDGTNITELFEKIGRETYDKIKLLGETG